jgi:hypothetical protein
MPHVDEGTLHALLDGALRAEAPERAARVEAHLAGCEDCRARLEAAETLRAQASGVLTEASPPAHAPDFGEVLARADPGTAHDPTTSESSGSKSGSGPGRQLRWTRRLGWAATIVLALGTGYLIRDLAGPVGTAGPAQVDAPSPAPEAVAEAGGAGEAAAGLEGDLQDSRRPVRTRPEAAASADAAPEPAAEARAGAVAESAAETPPGTAPQPSTTRRQAVAEEGLEEPIRVEAPTPSVRLRAQAVMAEGHERSRSDSMAPLELQREPIRSRATAAPENRLVPPDTGRWKAVTVEEARAALAGPLYRLPRAELTEVYLEEGDVDPRRVLTLQRLQTGVPVRVTQWRGTAEAQSEPEGAAAQSSLPEASRLHGQLRMPGLEQVSVVRGDFMLLLSATLPAPLLEVLAETAEPAP